MRIAIVAFAASAALTIPLFAQTTKEPWALTLEERIALRTNPGLAKERVRAAKDRADLLRLKSSGVAADEFTGRSNPELFLPHQVYRTLMGMTFLRSSAPRNREALMIEVLSYGLPSDFWDRLGAISARYISDSQELDALGESWQKQNGAAKARTERHIVAKKRDLCRSRAEAIAAARKEFGQERFDRFMYEVFAETMFHAADQLPRAQDLRYIEMGCP
jgi:hypothetical protein